MARLELQEYRTRYEVPLERAQLNALRGGMPSLSISPSAAGEGLYDLTPGSWVGVVRIGNTTVEIQPKIGISRLIFMLSYSINPQQWRSCQVEYRSDQGLVEALIPVFLSAVKQAIRPGILQGYRSEDAALLTVRGRLRFDDQIRERHGVYPPIEVRFDEFTEDIPINRLIKAALVRLEILASHGVIARTGLRAFRSTLERVRLCEFDPRALPSVQFNRLNERYRPAVELAKLILRSRSPELGQAGPSAAGFLVDMNVVFEDFVAIALREALGLSERLWGRHARGRNLRLDRARKVKLEPDLSWWEGTDCVFVGDAKYKRVNVPGIKNPDLYQLLAYTIAAGVPEGLLVYAAGEGEPACHEVVMAGKRLRVEVLDLSGSQEDILARTVELAAVIREMRPSGAAEPSEEHAALVV